MEKQIEMLSVVNVAGGGMNLNQWNYQNSLTWSSMVGVTNSCRTLTLMTGPA